MSLKNLIAENIILPLSDILTGQSVLSKLKFLQKSQFWSKEKIESFQNERLRILVNHAFENASYYKYLFNELKLKTEDIKTKEDLVKLPILTKQAIKKEGIERFTSNAISKKGLIKSSSSDSTGEPFQYYSTKRAESFMKAAIRG